MQQRSVNLSLEKEATAEKYALNPSSKLLDKQGQLLFQRSIL